MRMKFKYLPVAALALLLQQSVPALMPAAHAYSLDAANHKITVSPTGDYTKDIRSAISYLVNRSDKSTKWTLNFNPGKYSLYAPMYSVGLQNVDLISDPANPAVLVKGPNFSGNEYIFFTRMSSNITMRGLTFYGKTTFASDNNPVWPDQGVYFGSSRYITVDNNKFYNIGNAALRVTTDNADPVAGVNSFDTKVTNNTFNNVYQVSTTSNDQIHGATARYLFEGNTLTNLHASLKFATRTTGAKDVWIRNNNINGSDIYGIEMDNYSNFEVTGNTFQNIKSVAVTMYTNPRAPKGFQWGDNITFKGNTFKNVNRGIRFSNDPFEDGYVAVPKNLVFDNNTFTGVTTTSTSYPTISLLNRKIDGVKINYNKFNQIANKKYIGTGPAVNVTQLGNMVDGVAYGPQPSSPPVATEPAPAPSPTPAPAPTTGSTPAVPSGMAATFDGSTKVRLTWKDNATNETSEEVWVRPEGGKAQLLAKLYADSTLFTHTLSGSKPSIPYYYAVRAINSTGASALSPEVKMTFQTATAPAPAPTTGSTPAVPSGMAATFDGSTKVRLTWKDNATNETSEEVWVRPEGGKAQLLAKLYADSTLFTHTLSGSKPSIPYYYAVRAINSTGASALSPEVKTIF
ncbi:MAG TPA: right-handed parallel beta-helix repeat-containing protein [Coleofasciculaceae cyanobacterium]